MKRTLSEDAEMTPIENVDAPAPPPASSSSPPSNVAAVATPAPAPAMTSVLHQRHIINYYDRKPVVEFLGHQDVVLSCAFSPCGTKVVSGSSHENIMYLGPTKSLFLWEAATGNLIGTPNENLGAINDCKFTPGGERIVVCAEDSAVYLLDPNTCKEIAKMPTPGAGASFSRLVPICCACTQMEGCSEHNSLIAVGFNDHTTKLWPEVSLITKQDPILVLKGQTGDIQCCRFTPNKKFILTGSADGSVWLWDVQTGQSALAIKKAHEHGVMGLDYDRGISAMATCGAGDTTIMLWDLRTGTFGGTLVGSQDTVTSVEFNPNRAAGILYSTSIDGVIRAWDFCTRTPIVVANLHADVIIGATMCCSCSTSGKKLATGTPTNHVAIWDTSDIY